MNDREIQISIAQSINIAKDLLIDISEIDSLPVDLKGIANLSKEVYLKLFKPMQDAELSTQQRITRGQAINIAKDIALQNNKVAGKVTIVDDLVGIVPQILETLFIQGANEIFQSLQPQPTVQNAEDVLRILDQSNIDLIAFRNTNREVLSNLSKEDQDRIKQKLSTLNN